MENGEVGRCLHLRYTWLSRSPFAYVLTFPRETHPYICNTYAESTLRKGKGAEHWCVDVLKMKLSQMHAPLIQHIGCECASSPSQTSPREIIQRI